MFDAIVFAITDLGFVARSAREEDDGGEFRLAKIQRIIEQCRYGVHDISAVELFGAREKLPTPTHQKLTTNSAFASQVLRLTATRHRGAE